MRESRVANSVLHRRVAYTFDFELNLKPRWLTALGLGSLILYLGLVWSVWQPLVSSEWLRLGAAWPRLAVRRLPRWQPGDGLRLLAAAVMLTGLLLAHPAVIGVDPLAGL